MQYRTSAIIAVALATTLAACGGASTTSDDDPSVDPSVSQSANGSGSEMPTDGDSPSEHGSPSTDSSATGTDSEAPSPAADVPADHAASSPVSVSTTCELSTDSPSGTMTIAHPDGWNVDDECRYFDPEADSVESGTEPVGIDVVWQVSDTSFSRAAAPSQTLDEERRSTTTVAGRQAVRVQGTSTGEGLYPEGHNRTVWIVDLDVGTDDQGGVLIGSTHEGDGIAYAEAVDVLDKMASTVLFSQNPDNFGRVDATLARAEGGGTPFTVVLDDGCLQLRAGGLDGDVHDEVCDVSADDQPLTMWALSSGDLTVAAGFTGIDVDQIVVNPEADVLRGAIPVSIEGGHAVAMPVEEQDIYATTDDGEVLDVASWPTDFRSAR